MSAAHTPGPWQAIGTDPAEGGDWFWIKAQPNAAMRGFTKELATVNGSQADPVQQANASLIAAAPDLLEALAEAQRFITQPIHLDTPSGGPKTATYRVENYNALTGKMRAAIAKARGEA